MIGPFETYTRAVLPFRLGGERTAYATRQAPSGWLGPVLRQASRGGHCVLLGAGRGEAARELASRLPDGAGFTVCELHPDQAIEHGQGLPLLVDGSPVALAWLLFSVGLYRGSAFCVLNPEIGDPQARGRFQAVQKLHAAFTPLLQEPGARTEPFTVAAILHPDEPGLPEFFASLPESACECVAVWDGVSPPADPPPAPIPVRHLAHPLDGDFAAQRNRMLAACPDGWVLYLDADERLEPALAALLPDLTGMGGAAGVEGYAFPRLTACPEGMRTGWGLWPDLQLRLFRKRPGIRFVRPVHERLEGLAGPTGLTVGAHILHLSGILKPEIELARKHALFDRAAGQEGLHRLASEYPVLPASFFTSLAPAPVVGTWPATVRFAPL